MNPGQPHGIRSAGRGLALLLLAAAPAAQAGYGTAQLELASDRLFRGLSQSHGLSLAARGDYAFDANAYAGAFVANNRDAGDAEFDAYAGWREALVFRELVAYTLDGGVAANLYFGDGHGPRRQNLDYAEAYAGAAAGPASFKAYYAPDYYNLGRAAYRFNGSLRLPLSTRLVLSGTLAWNSGAGVRRLTATRTADGRGHDYLDYSLTLRQDLPRGFAALLQLGGTDLDIDGSRWPRVLVGLQKRFDF